MYFEAEEIENLRKVYNREHTSKIPEGPIKKVWSDLRNRFHAICAGNAECTVRSMIAKPAGPETWKKKIDEWLSSVEIDKLEKEFTKVFSTYYYVGSIPIDFDKKSQTGKCIVSSLCSLDITALYKKGYHQIGIIFNTDVSTGPGKHWVALFCDIRPELEFPRITYFDSYAYKPEKEIQILMKRWKERWDQTKIHSKPMEMTYNKTRHQYQDTECGMYSLYFHYCCLMGISMDTRVPDDVIRSFRGMLFKV